MSGSFYSGIPYLAKDYAAIAGGFGHDKPGPNTSSSLFSDLFVSDN
jgi:hypothetical protein